MNSKNANLHCYNGKNAIEKYKTKNVPRTIITVYTFA